MRASLAAAPLGGALLFLAFPGPSPLPWQPPAEQEAALVTVSVDPETDALTVSPDPVRVERGQKVEWTGGVDWAVSIPAPPGPPENRPFPPEVFEKGIHGGKNVRAGAAVRSNAANGRYKYTVAVFDGKRVRILDPEIIIGPG